MLALAAKLPDISDRQRRWAFDHCLSSRAIYKPRKREVRCLCCGQTAVYPREYIDACVDVGEYDCPFCGRSTSIEQHCKSTKYIEKKHFTIITTFRSIQLARTFEVGRSNYPSENFARYDIDEIFQIWVLDNGKEIITGRACHRSAFYLTWDFHKPPVIHTHNASASGCYQIDTYDISGNFLYPDIRVTPLLRRNGWTRRLADYKNFIPLTDAMRWLLSVPISEMLVKTGQYDLFLYMIRRHDRQIPFLHSVRIANRNGYIVDDAKMWIDTLSIAAELGMDTHNPKIVCPPDLRKTHDTLLTKVTRRRRKLEAQKKQAELEEWEEKYRHDKSRYFGITFGNDNITISVISSVAEMAEEGKKMHHCVFSAGYYKRDDSLILSARDQQGNRIETIELSLKTMKIIQSRGRFNTSTPLHDDILNLVTSHIHLFKSA